jgi:prepilin-type N-terminal cleavage/methylation domain-containing protein
VGNKTTYSKQSGFTFLELIAVIIIISILGLFSLDRLWALRAAAEQASITQVIGNIRSALGLEVVRIALQGKMPAVAALANTNPIPLLAQAPTNYLGEKDDDNVTEPGSWYFDKKHHALIYTVVYEENFKTTLKGLPRIRHQIKLVYYDNNNNNRFDIGLDNISGLDLLPVENFSWNTKFKRELNNIKKPL